MHAVSVMPACYDAALSTPALLGIPVAHQAGHLSPAHRGVAACCRLHTVFHQLDEQLHVCRARFGQRSVTEVSTPARRGGAWIGLLGLITLCTLLKLPALGLSRVK